MSPTAWFPGSVAVVTGGASGIGLAAATRFCCMGLKVCIADLGAARLATAVRYIREASGAADEAVMAVEIDVSEAAQLERLESAVAARFGGVDVLMNNAGIQVKSGALGPRDHWQRIMAVNLGGVVLGCQVFLPRMLERGRPGVVINTGSKQGITTPPGNPAYNVSKAGVKAYTEALQHELRNTADARIRAHLLIPGYVFTAINGPPAGDKPPGAWTANQTVEFMMERLAAGDFYILCPDNDVDRRLDERRILWAAGDLTNNRPPLSRWHPDYAEAFKAFCANDANDASDASTLDSRPGFAPRSVPDVR